jgi:lipoate-protein ligase A
MPRPLFQRSISVGLINKALHSLSVPSRVNDRFDLTLDGKKISGSAYKLVNQYCYHHGTMLIDSDLHVLQQSLSSPKKALVGGGIDSVPSKTINLKDTRYRPDIHHDLFSQAVMDVFLKEYGTDESQIHYFDESTLTSDVEEKAREMASSDWIFGQTPKFHLTVDDESCGRSTRLKLEVEKGRIQSISFERDEKDREEEEETFSLSLQTDIGSLLIGMMILLKVYRKGAE